MLWSLLLFSKMYYLDIQGLGNSHTWIFFLHFLCWFSTSTSRSDRSAQAKPPSAMSSDSVATSAELSPEMRVSILFRDLQDCSPSSTSYDTAWWNTFFVLPLLGEAQSYCKGKPTHKTHEILNVYKSYIFRSHSCFSSNKDCVFAESAQRIRQRGTTVTSKWNCARHGYVHNCLG